MAYNAQPKDQSCPELTACEPKHRATAPKDQRFLIGALQEEHLFPVHGRHGMQAPLLAAIIDNTRTAARLAELEHMPKSAAAFLSRMTEPRKAFQQHVRDDRKGLLSAALKALSDEGAYTMIETAEDEMARLREIKRTEARRAREQSETVQRALARGRASVRDEDWCAGRGSGTTLGSKR
jgi:hypothetical protein